MRNFFSHGVLSFGLIITFSLSNNNQVRSIYLPFPLSDFLAKGFIAFLLGLTVLNVPALAQGNYNPAAPFEPLKQSISGATAEDVMARIQASQYRALDELNGNQRESQQISKEDLELWQSESEKANNQPKRIFYDLPTRSQEIEARGYLTAFDRMLQMAEDPAQFSLGEAVYLTEMAYFNEQGGFDDFERQMEQVAAFLVDEMIQHGYDPESNLAKNLMLLRMFTDTLNSFGGNADHLPYGYDFEDYRGDEDWTKMFVLKLLHEKTGQCHSLPLLYLILAEQLGAEAYLAYAPEHTYVKFPLPSGGHQNVELTCGALTTNAHIMQSGYIKAEALQNRIYMQPLSQQELLSHCLIDLVQGYTRKFGYDAYMRQVITKAIELAPSNIFAHLLMSDYKTVRFQYVAEQIGTTEPTLELWLSRYPAAARLYRDMLKKYDEVDAMGYSDMPEEAYEQWLQFMADEETKQESDDLMWRMEKSLQH